MASAECNREKESNELCPPDGRGASGPGGGRWAEACDCTEACFDCVRACASCATACLNEDAPKSPSRCIQLDLDCANVCDATGKVFSRQTAVDPAVAKAAVEACARACKLCGDECEGHAGHHEHCNVCAEACRRCENSCNELLQTL